MTGGDGETQVEALVETPTLTSQKERQERRARIEELTGRVVPNRRTNRGFGHSAMNRIQKTTDDMKYVGLDVENMPGWQKFAYDAGTRLGLTSPWKRVGKERQKVEQFVFNLEDIVDDCKRYLYHPNKGLYTLLSEVETLQDEGIELRALSIEEMKDLKFEAGEARRQYQEKISGNGSSDQTAAQLLDKLRSVEQAYQTFKELKEEANLEIGQKQKQKEGLQMDINDRKAVITEAQEFVYDVRQTLIEYQSDTGLAEVVHAVSELIQGNVEPLEQYREHMTELRVIRAEATDGLSNLQSVSLAAGPTRVADYDRSSLYEQSRKKEEARDAMVEEIIQRKHDELFVGDEIFMEDEVLVN